MKNSSLFAELRGLIKAKFGTQGAFARAMGMNCSTLSEKLCGHVEWNRSEMEKAMKLCDKTMHDIPVYFF